VQFGTVLGAIWGCFGGYFWCSLGAIFSVVWVRFGAVLVAIFGAVSVLFGCCFWCSLGIVFGTTWVLFGAVFGAVWVLFLVVVR